MSELQAYYNNFACANVWADPDPERCGCRGSGWWLSDLDTFHKCPCHYNGQRHPEDYPYEDTDDEPCSQQHVGENPVQSHSSSDEGQAIHDVPF